MRIKVSMSKMNPVIYLIAWSTGTIDVCLMCSMWFWSHREVKTSSLQIDVRMTVGNHAHDAVALLYHELCLAERIFWSDLLLSGVEYAYS